MTIVAFPVKLSAFDASCEGDLLHMSKIYQTFCFLAMIFTPLLTNAAEFELNRDYKLVLKPQPPSHQNTVEVVEFFSYACPGCYALEPTLESWLITKPKYVSFDRIPVIYHLEWYPLAKAYYTAKVLHVANRITPILFATAHQGQQDLTNPATLSLFFQKEGVKAEDFSNTYHFLPGIDSQVSQGDQLMRQYGITVIPTFVINGLYQTDLRFSKGDPHRLMQIINFLIAQEAHKIPTHKK